MRDTVQIHVTADLPIRARALPFANRVEVRFGKAFPVALLVDHDAFVLFRDAITTAHRELEAVTDREADGA